MKKEKSLNFTKRKTNQKNIIFMIAGYLLFPFFLYIVLTCMYKTNLKEFGSKDGWLSFLGGYCGFGGALLVCILTLERQEKQFDEEKKLMRNEKIESNLKAYKSINFILKSILRDFDANVMSVKMRYIYSYAFIASYPVYNKNYFILSSKSLSLLEVNMQNVPSYKVSENLVEIVSLIEDIDSTANKIIKNSYDIYMKFNICYNLIKNIDNLAPMITAYYKEMHNDLESESDIINFLKSEIEEILCLLTVPQNLFIFKYEYSLKNMKTAEIFIKIRERMNILSSIFLQYGKEHVDSFVECIAAINSIISILYFPGIGYLREIILNTSVIIDNEIHKMEEEIKRINL